MVMIPSSVIHKPVDGPAYLDSIVSSACCDLDATIAASYGGSGQSWVNLIAAPADGAGQTAYDFYLGGTSAATTDDPTFNGSAGSAGAYFSVDGGDLFEIAAGNTTFINNLHKSDQTTLEFGAAITFWWPSAQTTGQFGICGTTTTAAQHGMELAFERGNSRFRLGQCNGTTEAAATFGSTSTTLRGDGWNVLVFTLQKTSGTAGNIKWWFNSNTENSGTFTGWGTTTTNATNGFRILRAGASTLWPSGARIASFSLFNNYLSDANAEAIIAAYATRHGRTYV